MLSTCITSLLTLSLLVLIHAPTIYTQSDFLVLKCNANASDKDHNTTKTYHFGA